MSNVGLVERKLMQKKFRVYNLKLFRAKKRSFKWKSWSFLWLPLVANPLIRVHVVGSVHVWSFQIVVNFITGLLLLND